MPNMRLTLASLALLAPLAAGAATAADAPVSGVWQLHEHNFTFMGFTSLYSCEGLEDKLKLLLKAAGARDDLKVSGTCSDPRGGPSKISGARVKFYALAPDGGAAAASPATAAPERRLGRDAPKLKVGAPPPEPGVGAWKTVEIRARSPSYIDAGDCELVDQFARELLPMLTTRNRESRMQCVPHQVSQGSIYLRFDTLAPLPKADVAARPVQ